MQQKDIIAKLLNPNLYPHDTTKFEVLETHISWVILTGEYAYKIKKELFFDFIDASTLEKRFAFCRDEIRLNKALAPEIYLDVVAIYGSYDNPNFESKGEIIEYAVKMKQFSHQQLLSEVDKNGNLSTKHIDDIATTVANFHANASNKLPNPTYGSFDTIHSYASDNFKTCLGINKTPQIRNILQQLSLWEEQQAEKLKAAFINRHRQGNIKEVHGDLHLGNIVLFKDEPKLFDSIDFNPELRWTDTVADYSFLIMDLESRGHFKLANRFLNRYLENIGDYDGVKTLNYYKSYRAMVRAKVALLTAINLEGTAQDDEITKFHQYISLTQAYSKSVTPSLILTHGVTGSGKSTFTQKIVDSLKNTIRLRSDVERKRLHGLHALESSKSIATDIYSPAANEKTFSYLKILSCELLAAGFNVIVDATFLKAQHRQQFIDIAIANNVQHLILEFKITTDELHRRVKLRAKHVQDASEADINILQMQLNTIEPLSLTEQSAAVTIDSGNLVAESQAITEIVHKITATDNATV